MAENLSRDYGLNYARLDDRLFAHIQSASVATQPALASLRAATCDQLWLIPPIAQARRTITAYFEEFPLHLADIADMAGPLLLEGAALLPCLVAPVLAAPGQAFYLLPTPTFQRRYYSLRTWTAEVVRDCSDPAQAYANWMRRDEIFGRWVRQNARHHGLAALMVDGTRDIAATTAVVARHFGLR